MVSCKIVLILFSLLIFSLVPGFVIARRLHSDVNVKFHASIVISLLVLYLSSFALYISVATLPVFWIFLGLLILMGTLNFRPFLIMLRTEAVKTQICIFGLFFLWNFLCLLLLRHYSMANWWGDWFEHYHRSLFFSEHLPLETKFFDTYSLPARPPMMNLICSFIMRLFGNDFWVFQITSVFLNSLASLGCLSVLRLYCPNLRRCSIVLLALLAFNPFVVHNVSYTWTKLFSAFLVLEGLSFLLNKDIKDSTRYLLGLGSLSLGVVAHYSALIYLATASIVIFLLLLKTKFSFIRSLFPACISSFLILTSWFGWAIATYGLKGAFSANATVADYAAISPVGTDIQLSFLDSLSIVFGNILHSFIPWPFALQFQSWLRQANWLGELRDYLGLIYQTNLIFACGLIGGLLLLYGLALELFRAIQKRNLAGLFLHLLAFACVMFFGSAVLGLSGIAYFGLSHLSFQPLVLLALVFLVRVFAGAPKYIKWIFLLGLIVDFLIWILPHIIVQHLSFPVSRNSGGLIIDASFAELLNPLAIASMKLKALNQLVFLGDLAANISFLVYMLLGLFSVFLLFTTARLITRPLSPMVSPSTREL